MFLKDFVIFDIETSGFKKECCDILEISAIKVENFNIVNTFSSLIKPKFRLNSVATAVNGITYDMVKDAPSIEHVLGNFLDFIGTYPLLGYNVTFDKNFVNYNLDINGFNILDNQIIDVLPLAKCLVSGVENYKQTTIANYFNVSTKCAHRALADCIMLFEIYKNLHKLV